MVKKTLDTYRHLEIFTILNMAECKLFFVPNLHTFIFAKYQKYINILEKINTTSYLNKILVTIKP